MRSLQTAGAVSEVFGSGKLPRYRHLAYDWLGVGKEELAILGELLLRGEQTEGDLRGRASRMDEIPDLTTLRRHLDRSPPGTSSSGSRPRAGAECSRTACCPRRSSRRFAASSALPPRPSQAGRRRPTTGSWRRSGSGSPNSKPRWPNSGGGSARGSGGEGSDGEGGDGRLVVAKGGATGGLPEAALAQRPAVPPARAGGLLCVNADGIRVREGQARANRAGVESRAQPGWRSEAFTERSAGRMPEQASREMARACPELGAVFAGGVLCKPE